MYEIDNFVGYINYLTTTPLKARLAKIRKIFIDI